MNRPTPQHAQAHFERALRPRARAIVAIAAAPRLASAFLALLLASAAVAQNDGQPPASPPSTTQVSATPTPGVDDQAQDRGWPRRFETGEYDIIVHQPQLDEWPDFKRISFRAAISIGRKGQEDRTFGAVRVSADTVIAYESRLVVITDRKVERVDFPDVEPAEAERLKAAVMSVTPSDKPMTISLDRLVAALDVSKVNVRKVDVSIAPPRIIASDKPAVIVIFMGKPRFKPVPGSDLMFAVNTNWDVFLDPGPSKYYLLDDKSWLVTDNLDKGTWSAANSLPAALSKLPADANWSDVRAAVPGVPAKEVPVVYVSHEPAELIVTQGAPEMEMIPGTKLMLVTNTESELFYNTTDKQYFLLAAGRWFKAGAVAGPWTAASGSLPDDFKMIPEDSDAGEVLVSVPGTAQANEAVIMASIPQKATVNRTEVTVNVVYDGAPQFKPIESTTVQYAYNTPYNVFLVDGKYYCCDNAVWFVSPAPTGAWAVCVSVPKAIYTIPPTSPKYNVTYVIVYESTPTTVVTGYTSGYSGQTVAATGAVMFGLGLLVGAAIADNDDCCWGYHYHSSYYSYGCGAHYYGGSAGYVAGGAVYGPYGGAGSYAAYNPATGTYSRGGYAYGPNGAAGYRTAYNPSTGTAAYRAGGTNGSSSWGRAGVSNGDDWVRGGYKSTANGSAAAIQGSGGGGAVHAQGNYGNGATVAKSPDGDVYAGKDGNVYKKTDDGWQQQTKSTSSQSTKSGGTTSSGQPPPPATTSGRSGGTTPSGQSPPPTTTSGRSGGTTPSGQPESPSTTRANSGTSTAQSTKQAPQQAGNLQSESAARDRGNQNAARTQQYQSSGRQAAPSGGGSRGGGGGGRRR